MFIVDAVVFTFAIAFSVCLSLLVSQPFNGAIVRLRANYLPKAVSLDNVLEDGQSSTNPRAISAFLLSERRSAAKIGPVVSGVFAMLARTKRLEGWQGVYKGSAPVALQLILLSFITFLFFDSTGSSTSAGGQYRAAPAAPGKFAFLSNLFFMAFVSLVALPLNVITYRTIVHPRPLPLSKPRENLKELLSYSEFTQPWRIYLLPGLIPATLAHVAWIGLATRLVRQMTVPSLGGLPAAQPADPNSDTYSGPNSSMLEVSSFGLAVFLVWNVLSVLVLAPLECATVRLSTQRPERQQPLHRAYARIPTSDGPSPFSHQATAGAQAQPGGVYSDETPAVGRLSNDKPLPSSPDAGRPSFAIEDEDEDETDRNDQPKPDGDEPTSVGAKKSANSPTDGSSDPVAGKAQPHRVLGGISSIPRPAPTQQPTPPSYKRPNLSSEPPEPVIALRPCDEPQSAEEAAQEFGAPVVQRYEGLIDCLNKMVDEEGLESLSRGAWVTLLGIFAGSFS
ncbi:hypothetical protein IE53DRAFT_383850 [Violaceomyces palustris]|uniref:Uncharacterized protein n=1 Tax=Violaceomyces palustris TaxID=1673888 RepID=A0ACD0P6L5_9BASI|nr:hypothetical protein IE53DRAFT_383850 [Violaceomyces palustris]